MRSQPNRFWLRAATALAGATLAASAQAFCGFYAGKADASLFNEASQVVLVRDGNRTVISMLNDYKGPLSEFALVVPTPVALQRGQVRVAEKKVFERLDAYSSPRLAEYHDNDPCQFNFNWGWNYYVSENQTQYSLRRHSPMPPPALAAARSDQEKSRDRALGVTVETQYTLDEYDIVSLSAQQSDGLETWLQENGYRVPKGASVALKPYINQGMKFFVAKVNLQQYNKSGYNTLRPLQFAFESEKFMLPMRLGMVNAPPDKPQDLIVYVLTRNGRVESSNYRTVKLPANMNLPYFVKPRFKDFYAAMFDKETRAEDYRVVFTEYFWDMSWCDPCVDNPLSPEELRKAGVFWVGGNADENFSAMQSSQAGQGRIALPAMGGGAQPVVLTRLHLRYTAASFPEDLALTQTRDRQNWQTRYVIQQPFSGSLSQCSAKLAKFNCEASCNERVQRIVDVRDPARLNPAFLGRDSQMLRQECLAACDGAKQRGLQAASNYYERDLPARLTREKQVLAQFTGWSISDIDQMPSSPAIKLGRRELGTNPGTNPSTSPGDQASPAPTWWQRLFGDSQPASKL